MTSDRDALHPPVATTVMHQHPEATLSNAGDLVRFQIDQNPNPRHHRYDALTPAQWLAMAGLMQPDPEMVVDLWRQAIAQGWDVREGCAWVVHWNRGDLVRPLAEKLGVDWAQELPRQRWCASGAKWTVSALGQALYPVGRHTLDAAKPAKLRAPSVVAAWQSLGLDSCQRLPTSIHLYAGVPSPIDTTITVPLPWLGVALANGAWSLAEQLMNDPRVLADQAGLSQALYAWTVTVWRHDTKVTLADGTHGDAKDDPTWPNRLIKAGALAHPFPWGASEISSKNLVIEKNPPRHETWVDTFAHQAWWTPNEANHRRAVCTAAPPWSTAQWAVRAAAAHQGRRPGSDAPLWQLLGSDERLWASMPDDVHGRSPLMIVLAHHSTSSSRYKIGALIDPTRKMLGAGAQDVWQGQSVVNTLIAGRPERSVDELLAALWLGVNDDLWALLDTITAARDHHVQQRSEHGHPPLTLPLLDDATLIQMAQGIAKTMTVAPSGSKSTAKPTEALTRWWTQQGPRFAIWLAPHQQAAWTLWCERTAGALPDPNDPQSPWKRTYPNNQERIAALSAHEERRALIASAALDSFVTTAEQGFRAEPTPLRARPRI